MHQYRGCVFLFHEMMKLLPGNYHDLLFSRVICSPWTGETTWDLKMRASRFPWSHLASLGGSRVANKQRCLFSHAGSSHPCCQGNMLRREGSPLETIGRLQKQINREMHKTWTSSLMLSPILNAICSKHLLMWLLRTRKQEGKIECVISRAQYF